METERIIQLLQSMCKPPCEINIKSIEDAGQGAKLVKFSFDDETQVAVYYPDNGIVFTPTDWQGDYPASVSEIPDYEWMDNEFNNAFVLDGLPRVSISRIK